MDALGGDGGMGVPDMGGMGNMGGDPMMGDPNAMGGDPNMMNGDPNMMDNGMEGGEQGEELDPKKNIQKEAGKLSQDLNNYENENGPDADLAKYVAGMVIAQATKSMTDSDKKEVVQKIEKGELADDENGSEGLGESIFRKKLSEITQLKEVINNILEPDDYSKNREEREIRNKFINKRKNPFVANR